MKESKEKKGYRHYDAEFKKNALKMVENGRSVSSVAKSLGIKPGLLYSWRSKAREEKPESEKEKDAELKALRKQLKQTEEERDILKKALSIFSRKP
jgi:transposase